MTKHEKQIRQEWFDFRYKQNKEREKQKTLNVQQWLKTMFKGGV